MKNQYFADQHDFFKYSLLITLSKHLDNGIFINWCLTPNDDSADGNLTNYINAPDLWRHRNPAVFDALKHYIETFDTEGRHVSRIHESPLEWLVGFYQPILENSSAEFRENWFKESLIPSKQFDLVFFDPDNGMEVPTVRYGARKSIKYVYIRELKTIWEINKSILIYQHFPHVNRERFKQDKANLLLEELPGSCVLSIANSQICFFLVLNENHKHISDSLKGDLSKWENHINITSHTFESDEFKDGNTPNLQIGAINRNQQRCCGTRGNAGTDHNAIAFKVKCQLCNYIYGVNSTNMWQCKCPQCQGGNSNIPF